MLVAFFKLNDNDYDVCTSTIERVNTPAKQQWKNSVNSFTAAPSTIFHMTAQPLGQSSELNKEATTWAGPP